MKKALAIILTLVLALGVFAACGGGNGGGSGKVKSVPGETKSYGKFTEVLVPEGFTFAGGSLIDESSEDTVRMNSDADYKFNFTITVREAGAGEEHVASNRSFNSNYNATDVKDYKTGDYTWNGVSFNNPEDDSWRTYAIYTTLDDGRDVTVAMSVTPGGDDIAAAVLASLKIAA